MIELSNLLEAGGNTVVPFASQHPKNRASKWSAYFPEGVDTQNAGIGDVPRFLYSPEARHKLEQLIREASPIDIAHLHIYYGQLTASILAPLKEAGIPIVQSLHEYKLTCPVYTHISQGEICEACGGTQFWKALPRRCNQGSLPRTLASVAEAYASRLLGDVRKVDHFIAVSDFLRRKMIEHEVVEPNNITTVHNFVRPEAFVPSEQQGEYLLYFGRIAPVKGLETLIESAAPLDEVPLYIVGEGEQRKELQKWVEDNDWSHIHFLGFQSGQKLHDLIRGSITTIIPSEWYENCPMTVLETIALGRPVVGSRIGGIPELIEEGKDGLLFPPGNVEALRERLEWMIDHPMQAVKMGKAGRAKVEDRFGPEAHYTQIQSVYDGVLQ
jgi:glycosyltransferase involved in cell wall biosynthesis